MRNVALVACVKSKLDHATPARDLYQSEWFRKARGIAERKFSDWYILSAEHYLLSPDKVIEPYEKTLNRMGKDERVGWSMRVYAMLLDIERPDLITIMAGSRYREFLVPLLIDNGFNVSIPMIGMGIGKQLAWMKNATALTAAR